MLSDSVGIIRNANDPLGDFNDVLCNLDDFYVVSLLYSRTSRISMRLGSILHCFTSFIIWIHDKKKSSISVCEDDPILLLQLHWHGDHYNQHDDRNNAVDADGLLLHWLVSSF